eukprot:UN07790
MSIRSYSWIVQTSPFEVVKMNFRSCKTIFSFEKRFF